MSDIWDVVSGAAETVADKAGDFLLGSDESPNSGALDWLWDWSNSPVGSAFVSGAAGAAGMYYAQKQAAKDAEKLAEKNYERDIKRNRRSAVPFTSTSTTGGLLTQGGLTSGGITGTGRN